MIDKPLYIMGAGGHGRVLADTARAMGANIVCFVERENSTLIGQHIDDLAVEPEGLLAALDPATVLLANGIGSTASMNARTQLFEKFSDYHFASIIHPQAIVSPTAILHQAIQILAGCIVQTGAIIGKNSIGNSGSRIEHHCRIGSHCHIATGAILCGDVTLADQCHVGAGATIIQGVSVGSGSLIAAGAVVTNNLPASSRVRGIPAREF